MISKCSYCLKEFKHKNKTAKFCSNKCRQANNYHTNKERRLEYIKKYRMINYERDKDKRKKWSANQKSDPLYKLKLKRRQSKYRQNSVNYSKSLCRIRTKRIFNELKLNKKCKFCDNTLVQIHHESYPIKDKDILKAISQNKIYYVCKEHHLKNAIC